MTAETTPEPTSSTGGAPWSCDVVNSDPLVVAVGGELDTLTGPLVHDALLAAIQGSSGPVRIEFGDVSFIDSQGLSTLISLRQQFPDRTFTLAGPRSNVRRLIEITGLNQTFEID
jgi:anti-anti-sigma factor